MKSILLISCPDQKGIIFSVTGKILSWGGNITHLEEHVEREEDHFFMRVEWEGGRCNITEELSQIAERFSMKWEYVQGEKKLKMAVFVSTLDHCLLDTLIRVESGQLPVEVAGIISNHQVLQTVAEQYGVRFAHFPVTKVNKKKQEKKMLILLDELKVDFLAIARYMRILGDEMVSVFKNRIINVHHSFLPAFVGAKPYHCAYARGVKIIGATSHFADTNLDEGPIIEQAVRRVGHHYTISDLMEIGREIEKEVFFVALRKYIERKIIVYKNRTIIFH